MNSAWRPSAGSTTMTVKFAEFWEECCMPATVEDIERFREFALQRVRTCTPAPELDELLVDWYDAKDQAAIHAAIAQGLAEMEAGLGRPAREVTAEICQRLGLTES